MAQRFVIHPTHPQARLVRRAADMVRGGALIAYPTDSCYALGCAIGAVGALARLRRVRGIDERHHLTLMCRDVAEIAEYTFILRARRQVPRRVTRGKTIGLRLPAHPVAQALLAELDEPMLSATLLLPGDAAPLSDAEAIRERLEHQIDLVIDAGDCGVQPSTIIDLTGEAPIVLRAGKGSLAPFAVEPV
jgi:tRNA A37 threonylcarbamoyladenosine synthetase subunit TsaC/SUA5/YrdC